MSTVTSVDEIKARSVSHSWLPIYSALEAILVYAGIVTYIWRWQHTHPHSWMALWGVVLVSQFLHRDTFRSLGLSLAGMRANAEVVLPIALAFYIPLLAIRFCAACPDGCTGESACCCFIARLRHLVCLSAVSHAIVFS